MCKSVFHCTINSCFAAADTLESNDLAAGSMAMVAYAKSEAILRRTRGALAVTRSYSLRLGNPNGAASLRREGKGGAALCAAVTANADRHAADLAAVVSDICAMGHRSLRAIAAELTRHGMMTRRGGGWHVSTVRNLLARLGVAGVEQDVGKETPAKG